MDGAHEMKTEIFNDYSAFLEREDKTLNGVAVEFARENSTTFEEAGCEGCWNCTDCIDCKGCFNCRDCKGCKYCTDCIDCKGCFNCRDCKGCKGCRGCTDCEDCKGCEGCDDRTDCEISLLIKQVEDVEGMLATDPCLPHKTELGLRLQERLGQMEENARTITAERNELHEALDNALIMGCQMTLDSFAGPKEALDHLISWECKVHCDPAVSNSPAAKAIAALCGEEVQGEINR